MFKIYTYENILNVFGIVEISGLKCLRIMFPLLMIMLFLRLI